MLRHFVVLGIGFASLNSGACDGALPFSSAGVFCLLGLAKISAANIGPISGEVLDPAGKPVPGAKVWLVNADTYYAKEPETLAETTTDEKGHFQLPAVQWERSTPNAFPPMLAARDAQGRLGTSNFDMSNYSQGKVSSTAKITLWEGKECEGRMIDDEGKPIAKASLTPLMRFAEPSSPGGYSFFFVPAELGKELTAQTDDDGRFRFQCFPASGQLFTRIRAGELGEPMADLIVGKTTTIRLKRPGTLHVTVTCAKDAKAVAGLPFLIISSEIESEPTVQGGAGLYYFHEAKTQDDGTFSLEKLPPGKYTLQPKFPAAVPYCESAAISAVVKSGETAREKVELIPAVKLQGMVADRATSKGVGGVRVALFGDSGDASRETVTDDQGKFSIYVKPGQARLFVWKAPEPYLTPGMMEDISSVDAAEGAMAPTLFLDRTMPVEALIVDAAGRPISDAEVRIASGSGEAFQKVLKSDASGKVALGHFSSRQTVAIRARTKNAAAPMKTFDVGKQKGLFRLTLSEKKAFALRGALVDDAGTPIVSANLKLLMSSTQSSRIGMPPARSPYSREDGYADFAGITVQECDKLDADGTFSFTGLWPDVQYRLLVKTPGHERHASVMVRAAADKTRDLGKITLARTVEAVEGSVLDSAGKPIADVRVFNSGDGPDPMETRTDSAGRFRLAGFRKGPVCVFAVKDGYQFAGLRTTAGTTDAKVTMLRSDEPAPKRPIALTNLPPEEQKKLAQALLEKAWEMAKNKKNNPISGLSQKLVQGFMGTRLGADDDYVANQRTNMVELMEKIDPEQAKTWTSELKAKSSANQARVRPPREEDVLQQEILKTAEDDIDEALSMLAKDPEQSVRQLQVLTEHFAEKDREKALRCAEEGVARARSLGQPDRTNEVVAWGQTVARLGNKDAAKKLIEEAADATDRWKTNRRYDEAFGKVATAIAPYDSSRAVALLKKVSNEYQQQAYRRQVAAALDDIAQVDALLKDADAETIKSVRMSWAYRIAPKRPADAVQALESVLKQMDNPETCLAGLAEIIGKNDPAVACALIDRSMAGLLQAKPAEDEPNANRPTSVLAARLAVVAGKVGYGDMEGIVLRVLALRSSPGKNDSPLPARENTLATAGVLALTDPASVRPMLQTLESASETIEDRETWIRAWALADPRHAAELAEKELAKVKPGDYSVGSVEEALALVRLLTLSPDERIKAVLPNYGQNAEAETRGPIYGWETEMEVTP